jgi:hypothetical protein
MLEKIDPKRVHGFLKASGRKVLNGNDKEILLTGWGLGNWLLCEGYMWLAPDKPHFDRPLRIETLVRDVAGSVYAETFWKQFRNNYITKDDIQKMAAFGYNSVRIPFNWRVLMEDEPGEIIFREDGFALLDRCIDWCEEYGVYAFLDMHGAPGGQTGANIDDSHDNLPRLLMDKDYWDKGIALWKELAARHANRWIVGGYDLLNEPIRPPGKDFADCDYLLPKLAAFYEEAIRAIRSVDKKHLLSIEGHHWSTSTDVFYRKFDDNMLIHFHRYGCAPDPAAYTNFLELSRRLDAPLWLGETGENKNEWYAAMFHLSLSLDIGYNVWPWKKMECTNSPFSIKKPSGWEAIIDYAEGGPKPGKKQVIALLDEYLENMKVHNCTQNSAVVSSVFRCPPCTVRGSDFDSLPGAGFSYSGNRKATNFFGYRRDSGMAIGLEDDINEEDARGWSRWNIYTLELTAGEYASYSIFKTHAGDTLALSLRALEDSHIAVHQNQVLIGEFDSAPGMEAPPVMLHAGMENTVKITVEKGKIVLSSLDFRLFQ